MAEDQHLIVGKSQVSLISLKERFLSDGYVILKSFLDNEVLASARNELSGLVDELAQELIEKKLAKESYSKEPFERRLCKLYSGRLEAAPKIFRAELHRKGLYPLFFHEGLLDVVRYFLNTDEIRLYPNYTCRPKVPQSVRHVALWHQDAGYTHSTEWHAARPYTVEEVSDATQCMVNVWLPLVKATVNNGCMQFIPCSHHLGLQKHVDSGEYLELDPSVLEPLRHQAVNIELAPGDVVLFGQMLFHCGLPNNSDHVRWSFDFRYQDAKAPTLRREKGHMAYSLLHPDQVVRDGDHWAKLELGGPNPR